MCPLFYVWSCGIAKKICEFPDTRSCFLSSHNKKVGPEPFWNHIYFSCSHFHRGSLLLSYLFPPLQVSRLIGNPKSSKISYEIVKKHIFFQYKLLWSRLYKSFGLRCYHNIIRQKCAGCQVTYLPKIDALLLQKRFQTFWTNDRLNHNGFRPCLKSHSKYYSLKSLINGEDDSKKINGW